MVRTWKVGRHFLMGHGVLMLCLGTALYSLGSLMTNPMLDELGYTVAVVLTVLCLLIPGVYFGVLANRACYRRQVAIYLLAGAFSIACWLIFWLIQSAPLDIRLLVLLAGLHGLFWGLWYVRLAFHFQAYPRKAVVLCVLAGTTSSLGITIATQSQLSKISAVTAVACYTMFIGVQILLTTAYLYRDCGFRTAGELLSGDSPKRNELNIAEDCAPGGKKQQVESECGSVGILTAAEIAEFAPGLDATGHSFKWLEGDSLDPNDLRFTLPALTIAQIQIALAGRVVLQMDQAALANQGVQGDRVKEEVERLVIQAYVAPMLQPWTRRFPPYFFREAYRLLGWEYKPSQMKHPDYATPVTFSGGFLEAESWFYPWLIGLMRYDGLNSPNDRINGISRHDTRSVYSPGLQILVRPNIKLETEYSHSYEQPVPGANTFYRANKFQSGIDFVF